MILILCYNYLYHFLGSRTCSTHDLCLRQQILSTGISYDSSSGLEIDIEDSTSARSFRSGLFCF
jgi:hypothetical protein